MKIILTRKEKLRNNYRLIIEQIKILNKRKWQIIREIEQEEKEERKEKKRNENKNK